MEMLRTISIAKSPLDVMRAFASKYWPLRPIDFLYSISCRDLPQGQYRITRAIDVRGILAGEMVYNPTATWLHRDQIPVHSGGFLGDIIADGEPKLITDLRVSDDPVLGNDLAGFRSAQIIPLFDNGEPRFWTAQFKREPAAFSVDAFEQALIVGNLLGGTNTRLLLVEEINQLNAKLRGQFEEVARVQRSLLPRQIPDLPGHKIATSYLTSDEAGGDYYDFFRLPPKDGPNGKHERWGIIIADVAGHGAAAATVMAMLHGVLHSFVSYNGGPSGPEEVIRHANSKLMDANLEGSFVTALFAEYTPATGELRYARAGHNPPIIKRASRTGQGSSEILDAGGGPPLGVFDPYEIDCEHTTLHPGDTLVLYTDGITEAFAPVAPGTKKDTPRDMFGMDRLTQSVGTCSCSPDSVVEAIHAGLFAHTAGSRTRADDQTLVVMQRAT